MPNPTWWEKIGNPHFSSFVSIMIRYDIKRNIPLELKIIPEWEKLAVKHTLKLIFNLNECNFLIKYDYKKTNPLTIIASIQV